MAYGSVLNVRRPRGWSLTELLVVVSLIMLLSSWALPALMQAYREARHPAAYVFVQGFLTRARSEALSNHADYAITLSGSTLTRTLILDSAGLQQNKAVETYTAPSGVELQEAFQLSLPPDSNDDTPLSFAFLSDGTISILTYDAGTDPGDTEAAPMWFDGSVRFTVVDHGRSTALNISRNGFMQCDRALP